MSNMATTQVTTFPNLSRDPNCDIVILAELAAAGVDCVYHAREQYQGVRAKVTGELHCGRFTFTRRRYYWIVKGEIPLELAERIYAESPADFQIRAGGQGVSRVPELASNCFDIKAKAFYTLATHEVDKDSAFHSLFVKQLDNPQDSATVNEYHIDTAEGLKYFVDTIKEKYQADWDYVRVGR